jgi:hypothetical protein
VESSDRLCPPSGSIISAITFAVNGSADMRSAGHVCRSVLPLSMSNSARSRAAIGGGRILCGQSSKAITMIDVAQLQKLFEEAVPTSDEVVFL